MNLLASAHGFVERLQVPLCASLTCRGSSWTRWKGRQNGIVLNGKWYCSDECFESELLRLLRECSRRPLALKNSVHRLPLGLLLLSRGVIDQAQLARALAKQQESPSVRIGECLQALGAVTEEDVVRALGAQHHLPVLLDHHLKLDPEAPVLLQELSHAICFRSHAASPTLHVGFGGDVDHQLIRALEFVLNINVEPCIVTSSAMITLTHETNERQRLREVILDGLSDEVELSRCIVSYAGQIGAERLRLANTRTCLWARLDSGKQTFDILSIRRNHSPLVEEQF